MTLVPILTTKQSTLSTKQVIQLLLRCIRTHLDDSIVSQIKALVCGEIDWDTLTVIAAKNGVIPLLYQTLNITCPKVLPTDVLSQLRHLFHTNALHNQFLTQELIQLLEFLRSNNITAIPFKGPTLAAMAYKNIGLRQFSDLDILVHPEDFLKARNLLLDHGYQRGIKHIFLTPEHTQDSEILRNLGEYPLLRNDGLVSVDLHQRLVTGREFILSSNFDDFWENLKPVSLLGTPVLTFRPEALLIYLCIHGTKEFWQRLIWICDVAELIQSHPKLDWSYVLQQARQLKVEQMLYMGLSLAQDLLDTQLPEEIKQTIQAKFNRKSLAIALQNCIHEESRDLPTMSAPQRFIFSLQMTEPLQDKIQTIFRMLAYWIPPTIEDQKICPLPRKLYFCYYLIRPMRLTCKYGLSIFKRVIR